jgi:hypothetical protein
LKSSRSLARGVTFAPGVIDGCGRYLRQAWSNFALNPRKRALDGFELRFA